MKSRDPNHHFSFGRAFAQSGISGKVALVLATWGGLGLLPVSGTFGTLGAVPLVIWMRGLGPFPRTLVVIAGIAVAMWASQVAKDLIGKEDPSQVVVDEVAGFLTAMAFLPCRWTDIGIGFVLFRLLDIWKPFPAAQMERLPGGVGIVMDDVVAGLYAFLGVWIILQVV
jgi:phosphatidylglycerophosphatase A